MADEVEEFMKETKDFRKKVMKRLDELESTDDSEPELIDFLKEEKDEKESETYECGECGHTQKNEFDFCPSCGSEIEEWE